MKLHSAIPLIAVAALICACGPPSIKKMPVPREQQIQAIRLMAQGDKLIQDGKDHLALLKYLEASQLNPYYEVIFNKLAVSYSRLHRFSQARAAVDRSIGLNRDYAYAYNTKGILKLTEHDLGGAVDAFERAISLEPDIANFYLNLGYALIQKREYTRALESYGKALELEPGIFEEDASLRLDYPGRQEISGSQYFEMARVFAELGNLEHCILYLGKAITAGFTDFTKIQEEKAFAKFLENEEFVQFLRLYGIEG